MKSIDNGAVGEIRASVLFERIRECVSRFVRLSDPEATAISLWVMMTHTLNAFDCVAYLSITSAEKQSGKTRLLEVLALLVLRPWLTGRTTPAVLARKINAEQPTLLLDESDATFKGDKDFAQALRGVLNTGYLRSGKTSLCVTRGKSIEYADFSTFGPKALAGIGKLPDTVADRSIPIRLTRKLASENVSRFRRGHVEPEASALRSEIEQWAKAFMAKEHPEPRGLDELPDRAADICEPLLMIAESSGEEVAAAARDALVALCGRVSCDESLGVQLLADIRTIFGDEATDKLASAALAARLAEVEESPWGPRFGRNFEARDLAKLLKPFEIRPHTIRLDDGKTTLKGYHRDDFRDAWARFIPSWEEPSQPSRASQTNKHRTFLGTATVTKPSRDDHATSRVLVDHGVSEPSQGSEPSREKRDDIRLVTDVTDVTAPQDGRECETFIVTDKGDGTLASCINCGGSWESHGYPPPEKWRVLDHATFDA
jgi:hypothetical protein